MTEKIEILESNQLIEVLNSRLPQWEKKNHFLERVIDTSGWRSTMMIANAIAHISEVAWHHPELSLSYGGVVINLHTHDVGGITYLDIELAEKIDSFLSWSPATDKDSYLPGTPKSHNYFG